MQKKLLFPLFLVIYEIAVYLSMDAYIPALPKIAHIFSTTVSNAQLTAVLWMVGGLTVQLFLGPLSERFGRRPIILYGAVLYIISSIICAISPNIEIMLIARFIQGTTMPSMFIAGYAAINELFDSESAVQILARMTSITILAPAFGPLLGGLFLLSFDWRYIFVILAALASITAIGLFITMPETLPKAKRLQKLHLGHTLQQYFATLKDLKFIAYSIATFAPIVGLISWMLAGPFIVMHKFHYSTLDYGLIQTIIFGFFIIGTKLVNRFANNDNNQRLITTGMKIAMMGAGLGVICSWLFPHSLLLLVVSISILTLGSGITIPILSRLSLEQSNALMGIKVTIFSCIRIASGVAGSICLMIFYNGSLLSITIIMLIFTALAALLWYRQVRS